MTETPAQSNLACQERETPILRAASLIVPL